MGVRANQFLNRLIQNKIIKPNYTGVISGGESGTDKKPIAFFHLKNQIAIAAGESMDTSLMSDEEIPTAQMEAEEGKDLIKITLDKLDDYYKAMSRIITSNPGLIDQTGTFKKNPMVKAMIYPALDILAYAYEEESNPIIEALNKVVSLISNASIAKKLKGTQATPFFYEGLQLILMETLYQLCNMVPVTLNKGVSMNDLKNVTNTSVMESYIAMITDIASPEVFDVLSNNIAFEDTPVKKNAAGAESGFLDFSGIADTPYAKYPEFDKYAGGESIVNAINFKKSGKLDIILSTLSACTLTAQMLSEKSLRNRYDTIQQIDAMIKDNNPDSRKRTLDEVINKYKGNLIDDLTKRKALQEAEENNAIEALF